MRFRNLALASLLAVPAAAAEVRPVAPGDVVVVELTADDAPVGGFGRGRVFELTADDDGAVTLELGSHDFDVALDVRTPDGDPLAAAGDGGPGWDARLVLATRAGAVYRIAALAPHEAVGTMTFAVRAGEVPTPTGEAAITAEIAWNRAVAERAEQRGDDASVCQYLLNAANQAFNAGRLGEAERDFERLLERARAIAHPAYAPIAQAFLGAIDVRRRRHDVALERLEGALAGVRALGLRDVERFVLDHAADALCGLGRHDEERGVLEDLLESARSDGDRESERVALTEIGQALDELHRGSEALLYLDEAVSVAEATGLPSELHAALRAKGAALLARGDLDGADVHLRRALELDPRDAVARVELGSVQLSRGRLSEAKRLLTRALEEARLAGLELEEAGALHGLGIVEARLGHHATALQHCRAALAILGESTDASYRWNIHHNIGLVHRALGDHEAERRELERALAMVRQLQEPELEAMTLVSIAVHDSNQDSVDAADAALDEAFALLEGLDQPAPRTLALALIARSSLALKRDEPVEALAFAQDALTRLDDLGESDQAMRALITVAQAALALGRVELAAETLVRAEERIHHSTVSASELEVETGRRSRFAPWSEAAQDLIALRWTRSEVDPTALLAEGFRAAGRWKGRELLAGIAEHRSGGRTPEARDLRRRRHSVLADREDLLRRIRDGVLSGAAGDDVDALRVRADQLADEAEQLAAELGRVSPADHSVDLPAGVAPEEVRRRVLAEGCLLVEYVRGRERLYAYVLGSSDATFLDLGSAAEIEDRVRAFVDGVSDPDRLSDTESLGADGGWLFDRLLAPAIAFAEDEVDELVVVPEASLSVLPFEALVLDSSGARTPSDLVFVIDRYTVTYGPSSPVLASLAETPARRAGARLLVLGDPVYASENAPTPADAARAPADVDALPRLPGTREEVLAIADLVLSIDGLEVPELRARLEQLRSARDGALETDELSLYLGAEATPARLRDDLRGYDVVHCAAHGHVDAQDPSQSGLALSAAPGESGFFPMAEILEGVLDAELTVLSACQTARGRVLRGEGVQSVARAFLYAGSRAVVASLWQVSDFATEQTMRRFYEALLHRGLSPPQALAEAKRAMRGQAPSRSEPTVSRGGALGGGVGGRRKSSDAGHPYYWAPFIHVGLP